MEMDYPLHPPGTLVDTIYDVIKKEIAASHLKPGEKLNSQMCIRDRGGGLPTSGRSQKGYEIPIVNHQV